MDETPPYRLDIAGLSSEPVEDAASAGAPKRPWVGVRFDCCGVYLRIYRNREGTAYEGACPKCTRRVRLKVGPDGTSSRFFVAE